MPKDNSTHSEGVMKGAILLLSIGQEEAAQVFKHLEPKEAQMLGMAMAELQSVNKEKVWGVLEEFCAAANQRASFDSNTADYIRNVLVNALGTDKAGNLLDRILHGSDVSGIDDLKWMDARAIAELITNEHPQIIATILAHLESDQASAVLNNMTERLRNDVMLRIATLDGVQPQALSELNDVLTNLLAGGNNLKKSAIGGVRAAAEILNFMGTQNEGSVLSTVRDYDPELAQSIQDEMFVFENLIDIDDRGIRTLLREVPSEALIVALKGTTEALREKIYKNMSQRAAAMLRDDLDAKGPVRLSEVETQQKEVLKVVRQLAEKGEIVLGTKGEDSFV